ncbi:hypothetical protein GCM10017784_35480 [Deinococcus indicus]|uniref:hypothetical protein n=1 Tax=Deinococcus indicus TaxID=223556 RepID=UPI00174B4E30|nr:hypothetical protein [Deinococcus indicus]GHG37870.1 hypothetical protein GCM10017784_35480 [Deinococcus indicus]
MSRLLINEPALQVLPSLAEKIGLNEAIFLQQLHFLTLPQRLTDGRRYYSTTVENWLTTFKFWSKRTVERIITSLRNRELIVTTDAFNQDPDDRTLWYAVNYAALEELEFDLSGMTEKPAPSRVRQNGGVQQDSEKQTPTRENAVLAESAKMAERVAEPSVSRRGGSANMADSSFLRSKTTTPTTEDMEAREALAVGGVGDEFQMWVEQLGLEAGPALSLTLRQWAAWVDEGLHSELKEVSVNVLLMGARANDPAAVLRGRMERLRAQAAVEGARRAEHARREVISQQIEAGQQFVSPAGQVLTVAEVVDGQVWWTDQEAREAPSTQVIGWRRAGGAA